MKPEPYNPSLDDVDYTPLDDDFSPLDDDYGLSGDDGSPDGDKLLNDALEPVGGVFAFVVIMIMVVIFYL